MVAGNDDGGILIEGLLLDPADELVDHPGGAPGHGGILLGVLVGAPLAVVAVGEMGVASEHGEIEGLPQLRQGGQLQLGSSEELGVLKAPPDIIIHGQPATILQLLDVHNVVISMLGEVVLPAAEEGVGAHQQSLVVARLLQNVANGDHAGHIAVLTAEILRIQRHLHIDAGGLGDHGGGSPGGAGEAQSAAQTVVIGKIHILPGKLRQLRDEIVIDGATGLRLAEGGLHALQEDVNEVALLLREGQRRPAGIHIVILHKFGLCHRSADKLDQLQLHGEQAHGKHQHRHRQGHRPPGHEPGKPAAVEADVGLVPPEGLAHIANAELVDPQLQHRGHHAEHAHPNRRRVDQVTVGTHGGGLHLIDELIQRHFIIFCSQPNGQKKQQISRQKRQRRQGFATAGPAKFRNRQFHAMHLLRY